jgi:tetratricopeptide (TPR) repeat protein
MRREAMSAGCLAASLLFSGCAPGLLQSADRTSPADLALRRQLSQDAQVAIDRGDWERARLALERLISETPRSAEVYHRLGRVLQEQGQTARAEACYKHALALDPEYPDALVGLGQTENKLGRPQAALKNIDNAIELSPARAESHLARGRVLEALNRPDDALAAYFRALSVDPNSAPALLRVAEIQLSRKQYDQALARLTHVLELTPESPEARHQRGRAHLALGHVTEAVDDLRFASAHLPRVPVVFYDLALALEQAKQKEAALAAAEQALKLAPGYANARDLSQRLRR